jgi:hypothetical protein
MAQSHPQHVLDTAQRMAAQGLPRSAIAAQLGMSRSMVCGMLWRANRPGRTVTAPRSAAWSPSKVVTKIRGTTIGPVEASSHQQHAVAAILDP